MIDILIFIFTYTPSILVHLVLLLGILCMVVSIFGCPIPSITSYLTTQAAKYVAILLVVVGLFLEGGLAVNNEYIQRMESWEGKIKVAEEKAKLVNAEIKTVYIEKIREVDKVRYITDTRIQRASEEMNNNCKLIPEVINTHNYAAKGLEK